MLRRAAHAGGRDALAAFGLSQPSLGSVGIKAPSAPGLPSIGPPSVPKAPSAGAGGGLGVSAAKLAYGEHEDIARRRRSVIDRAFTANDTAGGVIESVP